MGAPIRLLAEGARWALATRRASGRRPFLGSLVLTDRCNLDCRHCTVAHLGYPRTTWADALAMLQQLWDRGCRMVVLTGGEPFVWRDGEHELDDVVRAARVIGFPWVAVCTNGTFPLRSSADVLMVSVDGLPDDISALRGRRTAETVEQNLRQSFHPLVVGELTVTHETVPRLRESAEHVIGMPALRGVLFRLFTPYLGADPALALDEGERTRAIDELLALKQRFGDRVLNTRSGLLAWRRDDWGRPVWAALIACRGELTPCCCRAGIADDETCRRCGEPTAVELERLQHLVPRALLEGARLLSVGSFGAARSGGSLPVVTDAAGPPSRPFVGRSA